MTDLAALATAVLLAWLSAFIAGVAWMHGETVLSLLALPVTAYALGVAGEMLRMRWRECSR